MRWTAPLAVGLAALALASIASAAPDPLRARQWGLDMIGADAAHRISAGGGAVVAVVDTGVLASHPDLQGRLLAGHDFVQGDDTPQDGDGHGTHVTGVVAADTDNGVGVAGVAPDAKVLPIRVLGDDGGGDPATVAAGIEYAVARDAQVINLSLGPEVPIASTPLGNRQVNRAIGHALDRGVVVVAAAGNTGLPLCDQPSAQGRLLCVGSVDRRGQRSFFSNFGNGLGIVAPGGSALPLPDEDILSTWNDGGYEELAGTSQAAPHVAGVAALLVSLGLRGQDVVHRIQATARDVGPPGADPEYGAGIVDAAAAVNGLSNRSGAGGALPPGAPGASSAGTGSAGRVTLARSVRVRSLLRRGLRVRCLAAGSGRCVVHVALGRLTVARTSVQLQAGRSTVVVARARRTARARLRELRRPRRLTVRVALPGAPPQVRRVLLRP